MKTEIDYAGKLFSRIWPVILMALLALSLTGCEKFKKSKYENEIRQRFAKLSQALVDGNYDACVQFTDPAFVRAKGTEGTKILYKVIGGVVQLANLKTNDIRVDSISFSDDLQSAQVQTSHLVKGEWKPQKPYKWVHVQGQWYISFDR